MIPSTKRSTHERRREFENTENASEEEYSSRLTHTFGLHNEEADVDVWNV
jgi:hypothetical protein